MEDNLNFVVTWMTTSNFLKMKDDLNIFLKMGDLNFFLKMEDDLKEL